MMERYVFYTDEGYTVSPNGDDLESLQILGIEDGNTEAEAYSNLLKDSTWILESGFSEEKIRNYKVINKDQLL